MRAVESVVVTGASTGIGAATARVLVKHGMHVFGSVRKPADAEPIRRALGDAFTPLILAVTAPAALRRGATLVEEQLAGRTLAGLVNNAGIGIGGPLSIQPLEEVRRQLEVNVIGALAAVQAFLPLLGTDRARVGTPGRIVNITSVTGRIAPPFLGAYAASKHALEGLSESLRRELMLFGIDVIIVAPGHVATPIWDKAEAQDPARYAGSEYADSLRHFVEFMIKGGRRGLPAEHIGEVVFTALTAKRPRARYAVVQRPLLNWTLPRLLPRRFVDRMIAKQMKLRGGTPRA
jgi:NAD(P)-dependent dehydrogenase (short-subunit alcohol dehydrogenase family)